MRHIVLVLGGQRSGKSRYAEGLVAASGCSPGYIATATAGDSEMSARIARHQQRRGPEWALTEEPLELPEAVRAAASGSAVLVDCLTLWLSNLLEWRRDPEIEAGRLVAALADASGLVALVSNEVGFGIVPDNPLARYFADALGLLNQRVAAVADEVVLTVAGLPLFLKRAARTGAADG